jgi:hypothetical protein
VCSSAMGEAKSAAKISRVRLAEVRTACSAMVAAEVGAACSAMVFVYPVGIVRASFGGIVGRRRDREAGRAVRTYVGIGD